MRLPAVPHHCHQQGHGQQPREPSKSQQNCTAFPVQGHPLSWVHSTLPTMLPTARLTLPACILRSSGQRSFCCQEQGLSHRLEVFSREWLFKASHSNQVPGMSGSLMLLLITRLQAGHPSLESSCPHTLAGHRKSEKTTSLQIPPLAPSQGTQLIQGSPATKSRVWRR